MGSFIVNFHAKTDDAAIVQDVLAAEAERAWISPVRNGWVSFYEERSDIQDASRIEELCETVSAATGGPVISFLVHDSDFLCYFLFEAGRKRDQYNSCPDYFEDMSETFPSGDTAGAGPDRLAGDADALLPLCAAETGRADVERLLKVRPGEFVFAEQHLGQLADLLGIDSALSTTTYRDVGLEISPEELELVFVGSGTPPEPGEDSWGRHFGGQRGAAATSLGLFSPDESDADGGTPTVEGLPGLAQNPTQKLAYAVMVKNEDAIRQAIAEGADPNGPPLVTAAAVGTLEIVRLLIDAGASIQKSPEAFELAVTRGDETLVRFFLEQGADVHHVNASGWSILHMAIHCRNPQIVRLLLSHGADPKAKERQGATPMEMADEMIQQFETAMARSDRDGNLHPQIEEMLSAWRTIRAILNEAEDSERTPPA